MSPVLHLLARCLLGGRQVQASRFGGALSVSDLQGVNESTQGSTKRARGGPAC